MNSIDIIYYHQVLLFEAVHRLLLCLWDAQGFLDVSANLKLE